MHKLLDSHAHIHYEYMYMYMYKLPLRPRLPLLPSIDVDVADIHVTLQWLQQCIPAPLRQAPPMAGAEVGKTTARRRSAAASSASSSDPLL